MNLELSIIGTLGIEPDFESLSVAIVAFLKQFGSPELRRAG